MNFRFFYLPFLVALTLAGCHRKDDPTPSGPQLPAATQTGAGTMGCYVNGKLWLRDYPFATGPGRGVQVRAGGGQLFLLANQDPKTAQTTIKFEMSHGFRGVGSYALFFPERSGNEAFYSDESTLRFYFADSSVSNQLIITRFDSIQGVISGRFHFTALTRPSTGDTIRVTEGRFDFKLR